MDEAKIAAEVAAKMVLALLKSSEDVPYFGTVAKLINQIIGVIDQFKCNKEAAKALQVRFCFIANHLFLGQSGLAALAQTRSGNSDLGAFCTKMENILRVGCEELKKFTETGFVMLILKGSKPQELFTRLDKEMTDCLNELSIVLHVTQLTDQAKVYDVVCNIQSSIDQNGGMQGLIRDSDKLQQLANDIGADVSDLKTDLVDALASLSDQVSVVDENVNEMRSMMHNMRQALYNIQDKIHRTAPVEPADLTPVQLTHLAVDYTHPLGVGTFGKVYKGTYDLTDVAVKEVTVIATFTPEQLNELSREVLMHSKVANLPGVVRLFGANLTVEPRCIVLELADGSLHDALHKKTLAVNFTLPVKLSLAAQLCATMAAVSDLNIIHRDIKSANVLLFLNNRRVLAKLSDFGLSEMVNEGITTTTGAANPKGTPPYMAPELFNGIASSKSDMYAFAVLLNELLSELVPFPDCSYVQIVQSVGTLRERPAEFKASSSDDVGRELVRLIARCWHQDPALRMGFHELTAELTYLLRKAVEHAQQGYPAAPAAQFPELRPGATLPSVHLVSMRKRPAEKSDPTAQFMLGERYEKGEGVNVDYEKATQYYKLAAEQGHAGAQYSLGMCYYNGIGVTTDYIAALTYFKLSADQNHAGGQFGVGTYYFYDHDMRYGQHEAVKYYTLAANQGHRDAQYILGNCYFKGIGVMKICVETTLHYYKLAAAQHCPNALYSLGHILQFGETGVPQNIHAAVSYYKAAADLGHSNAQYELALHYASLPAGRVNYAVSAEYCKRAADQDHVPAQYMMARCYQDGKGVNKDHFEAVKYFQKAADLGNSSAQLCLGDCYISGSGVEVDYILAAKYYKLASYAFVRAKDAYTQLQQNHGVL